jgi:hypothetical protein
MSTLRLKIAAVVAVGLVLAAVLGASAGIVTAGPRSTLYPGLNLVGGPLYGNVAPADYLACLPSNSWRAIYLYDAPTQTWKHYVNTNLGYPAYINRSELGGITIIPQVAGLWILMEQQVDSPRVKDSPSDTCS